MTATHSCPICGGPMRPADIHALDRLVTGEDPFGVVECEACEFGLPPPQLSGEPPAALLAAGANPAGGQAGARGRGVGTSSTAISTAYSVHFLLAGRWTPGWKLWASCALSLPLLPFVFLGDRIGGGGDSCYVVMRNA